MKKLINRFWPAIALVLGFWAGPALSQNAVTVTTNAGDESVGSLGWAVTTLNSAGSGSITFSIATPITLTQPLAASTQNVTLLGTSNTVIGENESQSQFFFQQNFNQQGNLTFQNNGAGAGLDVAVTASSWTMGSNTITDLDAANGATATATSGVNVAGGTGGNTTVTVGAWTTGLATYINAGAGGGVTDTNGSGDVGGVGGSASATATSLVLPGADEYHVNGGIGGSVTDLGNGTNTGGAGGSATAAFGSVSIAFSGDFGVAGGIGGTGVTGGTGGAATLTAASVSLAGNILVRGGDGGNGVSVSGAGGNGFVSIGSYTGNSGSNFTLTGGNGGTSGTGGAGGSVLLQGGSATILGGPSAPIFKVIGGNGGLAAGGTAPGAGGQGGDTSISLVNFSIGVSTTLNLSSGFGGTGGANITPGGTGGAGGAGGNLSVTVGTLNLGVDSILNLSGGVGGGGGTSSGTGGTGGNGGAGGNVFLSVGAVTMAAGNSLDVFSGGGGAGGLAAASGSAGTSGQAVVTVGDLEGAGTVDMGGNALLQVAQGNFAGSLSGSETLQKSGSGILTLSGTNDYAGGTSILAGSLVVDTGGSLGTGTVVNVSGTLAYVQSATAGSSTILNDSAMDFGNNSTAGNAYITNNSGILFAANSTAGNATFTGNSGSQIAFSGLASGGSARFILNSGGVLDIGLNSTPVTVGSVEGAGSVSLGGKNLTTGINDLSTTFSGNLADGGLGSGVGGSLTKIGTGTFTLSGINTYTGGTSLNAGNLAVGSSQALGTGPVAVNGGTLSTAGTALTFHIGGNYSQGSGGTLQLGLGGAGASSADGFNATGSANLNGTLNLVPSYGALTGLPVGSLVTVITASSVNGMFQKVDESFNGIRLLPLYLSNAVELESIIPSFQAVGLTPNQKAIGADLDGIALKPQANSLIAAVGGLSNSAMQAAYSQLSPEDFTALYQAGFEEAMARSAVVEDRLSQLRAEIDRTVWLPGFSNSNRPWFAANLPASQEAAMAPKKDSGWSGFISGNGGVFNVASDGNASGFKATAYGLTAAGTDLRLSREAAVGLMAGYGHTDVNLGTSGTLGADGGQFGLYGLFYSEGFYADGLAEGGINSYSTQRLGVNGIATGSTQGSEYDGAVEMGYSFKQDKVGVGPFGSLQYTHVGFNAFTEQGSQAPLKIPAQGENSLLSQLGIQGSGYWKAGTATLDPTIKLAWEHEYNYQGGTMEAGFGTGDSFTVAGPQIGQDGILIGAGMEVAFSKDFSVNVNYQGELNRTNLSSNQIGGGARIGF